jgi:hypothetical protein
MAKAKKVEPKGVSVSRPWLDTIQKSNLSEWDKKFLREHWTIPFGSLMNNAPKCAKLNEYVKQVDVIAQLAMSLDEQAFMTYLKKVEGETQEFKTNGTGTAKNVDVKRSSGVVEGKPSNGAGVV